MALLPVHWRADVAAHPSGVLDKQALNAAVISDDPQAAALREEVRATMAQVRATDLHQLHAQINSALCTVISDDPQAAALREEVRATMAQVRATDLHQLHAQINSALCTAAAKVFPARRLADDRISAQAGFRASAKLTWQLYAAMRRPRLAAAKRILQKWRAAAAFHKASRQLREQSRALKKHAFQVKLAQAEAAAVKQDQRTLHQIVRSLSRAPRKQFSRLRDPEGRLLSKAAEAQALVDQGRLTYSLYPDLQLSTDMSDSFEVTDEELVAQLRAAKPGKAVPPHIAPAACWRLCADLIGPCLGTAMREHFRQGHPGLLHGDLTDATMAMLPKPGTMDALLRIHKHLDDAARLIRSNRVDRFGRHSGRKPLAFTGALSLSLDLSRAFDLTDRPSLFRALRDYQVPQAVVEVAQRLHFGARFVYKAGDYQAHFTPTNGLKQGCRLAPCLWVWCTLALMDTLESRLPQGWIDDILTLFADDCWGSWLLHSLSDLRKALSELAILLCTLEDYKMQINYSKTAVLLKFVGKQAKQALHEITVMKNGVRHLRLVVSKEYHQQQEEGTLTAQSSLRTLLLACMMKQLRDRINHMLSTQEGTRKLQTAGCLTANQEWMRHKWCRQAKRLVIDTEAPPVAHASLMESIDFLLANLRGDVVQKFHSTQNLGKMEAAQTHTATFFLSISLRGPTAEQVHTRFTSLLKITALQLIGLSMKRATLQRSQLAQQVAALAFGRMEVPDIFETDLRTELERRLSGRIYLLDICLRQLVRDMDILQERMDKLDGLMSMIRLRLPVMITVGTS
eukprot:s3626_g2.t1